MQVFHKLQGQYPGPLFTKRTDVLQLDLMKPEAARLLKRSYRSEIWQASR